ncbi:MAG TPA: hypothetical protein VKF82_11775 [Candidatus Eremiobacteraceae bacterium]|nr:hypothetical protein [Candidatus Eremiobacteraceae bacterium]
MSLEVLSTAASIGSFVVIAATALAAIVQLQHLRTSNQLTGLLNILGRSEDPQFSEWRQGTKKLASQGVQDPAFRKSIEDNTYNRQDAPFLHLYNWYDYVGSLVKQRLIPAEAIMDVYSWVLVNDWKDGEDLIAISRRVGGSGIWENFEYLVVLAREWLDSHQGSAYPKGARRIALKDRWLAQDHPAA